METETLNSRSKGEVYVRRSIYITAPFFAPHRQSGCRLALPAIPHAVSAAEKKDGKEKGPEVNPVEDLMREHGVLRRVLLIYEESIKRINGAGQLPPGVVGDTAGIVRRFVEDYHEKLEEDEIFPRLDCS